LFKKIFRGYRYFSGAALNIHVTRDNLAEVIEKLNDKDLLCFDTETTGFNSYHAATMFSVAISDGAINYYFNFIPYKGLDEKFVLKPIDLLPITTKQRAWIAHNAKFDLHFMNKAGVKPIGPVVCTEVMACIFNNNHKYSGGYGLDACAKRWLNEAKDDRVKQWMDDNNAFTMGFTPDGRSDKHYFFNLVPFEIISEYAMMDVELTFKLYKFLKENMYENQAHATEIKLTNVLFEMERRGVLIDRSYCEAAKKFELDRAAHTETVLKALCGGEFTDSAKFLAPLLEARGFKLPTTEKGNAQVTDEVLSQFPGDLLSRALLEYRDATKRASTYFGNYLALADNDDVIHPNFRQTGTVTGRMSCFNPNLQNIPAEDGGKFPLRKAFIAREGFEFVSIDFMAMEFRLMLEYANESALIQKIKDGLDPHEATAQLAGITRKQAKTLNFMILYGAGIGKIAQALGVSYEEGRQFKNKYFEALPNVKRFIRAASNAQASRGFTFSWTGRRFYIDDQKWSYKSCNCIIQGGAAEICKLAMIRIHEFLFGNESRMVLQVHDEIILEKPLKASGIIESIKEIMENAFEAKNMPMACSVSVGQNLNELEDCLENSSSV
jgi:DNA polymerase-1